MKKFVAVLIIAVALIVLFFFLVRVKDSARTPKSSSTKPKETKSVKPAKPKPPRNSVKSEKYEGAWFSIKYPADFQVEEREKSAGADRYDGVAFISPDKEAEFYVFSPQWAGTSEWGKVAANEKISSSSSQKQNNKTIKRTTITSKDGSYDRAYQVIEDGPSIRYLFGFKYSGKEAYNLYKKEYQAFKNSLTQFAD